MEKSFTTLKEIKKYISISDGNSKMGYVPSISLPPIKTCASNAPCKKDCYAMKAYRLYKNTRTAYDKNLETYTKSPELYFDAISAWMDKKTPDFFRFHVSGDIPDREYATQLIKLAQNQPDVKILVFTKRYQIFKGLRIPQNLKIVFSAWSGYKMPSQNRFPIAFMRDQKNIDKRIKNVIECPGNCEGCGMCWNLKDINKNVVFNKH